MLMKTKLFSFGERHSLRFRNTSLLLMVLVGCLSFCGSAFAQITNQGTSSATTTTTTLTINRPAGLAVGDMMFLSVVQSDSNGDALADPAPSGWTKIAGNQIGNSGSSKWRGALYYRVAIAGDLSIPSISITLSAGTNNDGATGAITVFRGVDTGNPFDSSANTLLASSSVSSLSTSSQTTSDINSATVLFAFTGQAASAYSNWDATTPNTLNEIYDVPNATGLSPNSIGAAWAIKSATGNTGTASVAISPNGRGGVVLVNLKQALSLNIGTVSGSPFCRGAVFSVPVDQVGTFASGNDYTVQLSNASGNFGSPITIGTLNNTSTTSAITATIPTGQAAGTGYRIRVVSSSPAINSANNGVNLTVLPVATVAAGTAVTMCQSAGSVNVTAGSSATGQNSVTWSSSGSGTFEDSDSLTAATYTPSTADITAGSVTLTLMANGTCNSPTSTKTLTISRTPSATAGGSATICQNQTHQVQGATSSNGTISWSENGAGSITAGGTSLTPTYTAAAGDAGNTVTLTMTVTNNPCTPATATYTINVTASAVVNAGNAVSTCADSGTVSISAGSSASNSTGVVWTSSGTGTFTDATSLTTAAYTPSPADITAGSVTLTLTASGNSPCGNTSATKVLTINALPVVANAVICQGGTGALTSATVCPLSTPVASPQNSATAGANATGTGTVAWAGAGNIASAGTPYATAATSAFNSSNYLQATNFGFTIPAGSTINGIQVAINRQGSSTSFTLGVTDNQIRLMKNGAVVGDDKGTDTNWPTTMAVANYGGTSDVWGTTWTTANINATNFGVAISAASLASRTATVDYVRVTVTYSPPGDLNWYTVSSGGTSIGSGSSFDPVGVANSGIADNMATGVYTFYAECSTTPGCRQAATFTINALPTVSFTGLAASYCQDAAAVTLTGNQSGGTFTGNGVTNNGNGSASFNPATAGVGTHSITYSYTDGNTCTNTQVQSVQVLQNVTYYADADGDTFGNAAVSTISCNGAPSGFVINNTDCDDNDSTINTTFAFYVDADQDTFGTGVSTTLVCAVDANTPPAGYSVNNTDCDDANNAIHQEYPFFADADLDGFGSSTIVNVCAVDANTPPAGYSLNGTDCNDNDSAIHAEYAFYTDADGDTYGTGELISVCAVDANTPPANFSINNTDCNDELAGINPGQSEILYNGIDDNCDGELDEGNQLVSQVAPSQCGTTLNTIGSIIGAVSLGAPVNGYRFKVTNTVTNQEQILDRPVAHFYLTQLATYDYAATYSVQVMVRRNGIWLGYYGPSCLISTPAILDSNGAAQIVPSQCGITLPSISTLIATTSINRVTIYRFRVTNLSDPAALQPVQILDRTVNWISLNMLTEYTYGTTYLIEVAVKTNGEFSLFGNGCEVSSPAVPTIVQCDGVIPSANSLISTTSLNRVTSYRFEVTDMTTFETTIVERGQNYFNLKMVSVYTPGGQIAVRVGLKTSGVWSAYGETCYITAPGGTRTIAGQQGGDASPEMAFRVVSYPNPYMESFALDVDLPTEDKVQVRVYDMLGKVVETRTFEAVETETQQFGSNLAAGVYNIVVTQGENVKSLRIIKR